MEHLSESVRLRAYGQHDPLVEYRREGHQLFQGLLATFDEWVFMNIFHFVGEHAEAHRIQAQPQKTNDPKFNNVGRNDPCPCGSGKKYKKCHGK